MDRSAATPFPAAVQTAAARVSAALGNCTCDQVTVNDYPPGVGLNPHVDTHSAFAGALLVVRPANVRQAAACLGLSHAVAYVSGASKAADALKQCNVKHLIRS